MLNKKAILYSTAPPAATIVKKCAPCVCSWCGHTLDAMSQGHMDSVVVITEVGNSLASTGPLTVTIAPTVWLVEPKVWQITVYYNQTLCLCVNDESELRSAFSSFWRQAKTTHRDLNLSYLNHFSDFIFLLCLQMEAQWHSWFKTNM